MSRVTLHDESSAPDAVKPFYAKGHPGALAASLANVPDLMHAALPFIGRTLGPSAIGARTKEIVILRASALLRCRYCTQTHTVVAMDSGLTKDEVQALRGESDVRKAFSAAAELALVMWTDAVAIGPGKVEDSLAMRLREHFTEAEVVELTLLVGATVMLNRYATALDLPTAETHLVRLGQVGLA